jgi:alkanesulfonate monooxygenase SsuD/methylene tetrahydromethanopterin reductase-like flavin-dependent oxidoreductase (luciferase family)
MAGRGSFIESFPLFGQDLNDYDALFAENLDLLLRIRADERVSWRGGTGPGHRPAIEDRGVYPRPERELPVWIAVGGTPQSVVRAGTLGLPLALAIIGGYPERFAPLVELYREAGRRAGHAREKLKVGINSHGFVADDPRRAGDTFFPPYAAMMGRIGRERGWPPLSRAQFDAGLDLRGHLVAGSQQQVIDKIMFQHELFHHDRFLLQISVGPLPHAEVLRAIELLGTKVAPVVRRETAAASLATEA